MQYLGTIDKTKDIINKEFVEKLLGNYQPLISDSSKLAYSLISGVPSSLPASDVYPWAKAATKPEYSWGEIGSKPIFASVATSGKYDDLIGKPTLLSSFTDDVVSGNYLPLSGGTLSSNSRSPLTLKSGSSENHSLLLFNRGSDYWGSIGFNAANSLIFKDTNGANYAIWHSGNDGSGSGLDADLLDGKHLSDLRIWGQSFDGTGNVDGVLTLNQSTPYASIKINSTYSTLPQSFITFQAEGVDKGNVGWTQASGTHLYNATARTTLELTNGGELRYGDPGNGVLVWHADNSNLSTADWKVSNLYCYCGGASRQFVVSQKSYTWNGDTSLYPLIGTTSVQDNQMFTMIAFPHIPFLKHGSRGYSGNSYGSIVRFEGSTSNANIWDIGCPASSENAFFIKCNDRNIASWGDTGLMGIYVPNQWLSNSMLVLGRKDSSLMTNQYAQIGITDGNLHLDAYKGYGIYLNFYQNNTGVIIDKDSNLLVSGGITMYGTSDKRLKKNIRTLSASDTLMSLGGVYQFEYTDDEVERNSRYKGTHFGLIYQNVKQTSLVKMCYEREDGYGALNYLDTSFISLLAGVGMEHETRIKKLERENKDLKKELEYVRRKMGNN